jgi:RNA polymerase sigma-70 factor (sigma-E family)
MEPIEPASDLVLRNDLAVATEVDFDGFCRSLSPRLIGSLVLQTGDRARAEDVAQEALARAWLRWGEVAAMGNPDGWVFTVAFNLARDGQRRRASEARANLRSVSGTDTVDTDADVADRVALERALREMPHRQRSVIALRYYAGMSVSETAQVMGCAEGTVKSLTSAAVQKLRTILHIDLPVDETKGATR